MWYVNISDISDEYLEIIGYYVVWEDDEFKIYRDYYGCEQIVRKSKPLLAVHDANDRDAILRRSSVKDVISGPPKRQN
jgi:hypothetical protein